MKQIWFVAVLAISAFSLVLVSPIFAASGFTTEEISDELKEDVCQSTQFRVSSSEQEKRGIEGFDVSDDGKVALALVRSSQNQGAVVVYDADGSFLYAVIFDTYGKYGVEWKNDELYVLFVRSNLAVSLRSDGTVHTVERIADTLENQAYWREEIFATTRACNDATYTLQNEASILRLFATSYARLVIDVDGEQSVFYDASTQSPARTVIVIAFVLCFVGIAIAVLIKRIIRMNAKK